MSTFALLIFDSYEANESNMGTPKCFLSIKRISKVRIPGKNLNM